MSGFLDRFSELPDNLIDFIISLVPLRDAVKTSALSTKWRHNWTRTPKLVLDWRFSTKIIDYGIGDDDVIEAAYISTVGNIISSHSGPIRVFHLHVPDHGFSSLPISDAISNWIHSVSQCRVQHLTLEYYTPHCDYNLFPPSLFQCVELKHLCLQYVRLEHPHNFRKFSSLVDLDLICVEASGDMLTNIILNCPLLERFSLSYWGIDVEDGPFILSASKLKLLSVSYCYPIRFILKNSPNISSLSIEFDETVEVEYPEEYLKEGQGMDDFFKAIPKIENINLHSYVLGEWGWRGVPERLPSPLENHTSLIISDLDLSSLEQLRSMFCLIKSSPKLHILDISMSVSNVEAQDTRDFLQSQVRLAEKLSRLRHVKLTNLMGDESQIVLIEIILSFCPVLEKLHLNSSGNISSEAEHKMKTNIMGLRRSSTKAEVIYSKLE